MLPVRMCVHRPAVDVVNEGVDDVSEDEGPGSPQAVLHLFEQQVDKQVIHEEDAMALIAVGRLCFSFTHRQQNPLDRNLQHKDDQDNIITELGKHKQLNRFILIVNNTRKSTQGKVKHLTGVFDRMVTKDLWLALWHLLR